MSVNYKRANHYTMPPSFGTEQNRFGRKTDEITKFSILDRKIEFAIMDGMWMKNGQMAN